MVGDPRVDHVVFTGSVHGGTRISQAGAGRFLQIGYELGGNDPAYVAADADVARSVENLVDGAMYNAGQSCCAVERVYVHRRHYAAFVEAALPLARAYVLGDPLAAETTLGPIAQPGHVAELEALVRDAVRARREAAPRRPAHRGRRARPLLRADGAGRRAAAARAMQDEQFGPILAVQRGRTRTRRRSRA